MIFKLENFISQQRISETIKKQKLEPRRANTCCSKEWRKNKWIKDKIIQMIQLIIESVVSIISMSYIEAKVEASIISWHIEYQMNFI